MTDRLVKYLKALARRHVTMTLRQIEILSSDFDVSSRDLDGLVAATRRYVGSGVLLTAPAEEIYADLKNIVYSAYGDKDTLLMLLPYLAERYRQDKLKIVYDLLMIAAGQAKQLGATPEELQEFASLACGDQAKIWTRRLWILWLISMVLFFALYLTYGRYWFSWAERTKGVEVSSSNLYLGTSGGILQEPPLGESRSLNLGVSVVGYNDLPLKTSVSSVIVFPESYLYDLRAGITLPHEIESYRYHLAVRDIAGKEIQTFTGEVKEPAAGLWTEGTTLPFEFQHFDLNRPVGTPYSFDLQFEELRTSSRSEESLRPLSLTITNQSPQDVRLSGSLVAAEWQENFGIWQGSFVVELLHDEGSAVRKLKTQFVILDEAAQELGRFQMLLLTKEHSLPLSRGETRRFYLSHDFVKAFTGELPARARSYRLEVLEWQ